MSKQVDDWNKWIAEPKNKALCDPATLGAPALTPDHYLINRINITFNDAYRLGRLAEREEITRWLGMLFATRPTLQ